MPVLTPPTPAVTPDAAKDVLVQTVAAGPPHCLHVRVAPGARAATVLAEVRRATGEDAFRLARPGGGFFGPADPVYDHFTAGQTVFAIRDADISAG